MAMLLNTLKNLNIISNLPIQLLLECLDTLLSNLLIIMVGQLGTAELAAVFG